MSVLNAFTAIVWVTPLIIGVLMGQWLRRSMRPAVRVTTWLIYLVWGWRWAVIWNSMNSGGSGRFAFEDLIFILGVWGTIGLGAVSIVWAEATRSRASR